MKSRAERERIILLWMLKDGGAVNVCNRDFVESYCEATGAPSQITNFGADKCRQLGLDLSRMSVNGYLPRGRTGITGMAGMGFPRWVWSYRLSESGRLEAESIRAVLSDKAASNNI